MMIAVKFKLPFSKIKTEPSKTDDVIYKLKDFFKEKTVKGFVESAEAAYGSEMKKNDGKQIETKLNYEVDRMVDKLHGNYKIQENILEKERVEAFRIFELGHVYRLIGKVDDSASLSTAWRNVKKNVGWPA